MDQRKPVQALFGIKNDVMSRAAPDKPTEEEEDRSSDEEEEKYGLPHSSSSPTMLDYSYPEPLEPGTSQSGLASLSGFELQTSGLRTRGPGRPRIHPLKPAGVSRPRGRPKGSRNKKPRKRLEKPPKRPRGRPRKWPPEMWEGFQRVRHTTHHRVKQHPPMHHHQDMPGPSHMYMEPSEADVSGMQPMSSGMHPMQASMHHPHLHQPLPQYMQLPAEPEASHDLQLGLSHHPSVSEMAQAHQQLIIPPGPPLVLPETEEHTQQQLTDPEELLWMRQLHPDQPHPPTTTR